MKIKRILIVLFLAMAMLLTLAACKTTNKIESISIKSVPTKTVYFVGDSELDLTGGVITVCYDNEETKDVSMTGDMISGFNTQVEGAVQITVTYKNFSVFFDIEVKTLSHGQVESISIKNAPTKTEYFVGDSELDLTGGIITACYEDGHTEDLPIVAGMVSGFNTEAAGNVEITVTYENCSNSFFIVVNAIPVATGIEVFAPNKTSYFRNDTNLVLTGGIVRVSYDNGTHEDINMQDIEADITFIFDFSQLGETTVTVIYLGFEDSFEVAVDYSFEFLADLITTAQAALSEYFDSLYMACYFALKAEVTWIYANGDSAIIAEYEAVYKSDYESVERLYLTIIYENEFDGEIFSEFLSLFTDMVYRLEIGGSYGIEDEDFDSNVGRMLSLFKELTPNEQILFLNIYDSYIYYFSFVRTYYSQYLNATELTAFGHFLDASVFYTYYVTQGDRLADFMSSMSKFISAYGNIADKTKFLSYFGEEMAAHRELYDHQNSFVMPIELGVIYDYMTTEIGFAYQAAAYFSDFTYYMIYFPVLEEMVNYVYANCSQSIIDIFETEMFSGATMKQAYDLYYDLYYEAVAKITVTLEPFFDHYMVVAGKWIDAGGNMGGPADDMSSYDGDLYDDIAGVVAEFDLLAISDQFEFIWLAGIIFNYISHQYYEHVLTVDQCEVFDFLYMAREEYIQYAINGGDASWFKLQMQKCITAYGLLLDKSAFDFYLGDIYSYYVGIYQAMIGGSDDIRLPEACLPSFKTSYVECCN